MKKSNRVKSFIVIEKEPFIFPADKTIEEQEQDLDESDFSSIRQLALGKITIPVEKGKNIEILREVSVKEYSFKVFEYLRKLDGIDNK